jgi:transposase
MWVDARDGLKMSRQTPEILEVDPHQLQEVVRRAAESLDQKDAELIRAVFESYAYVVELVQDKNTSIRRLRKLFFGARTEKTAAVLGRSADSPEGSTSGPASANGQASPEESDEPEPDEAEPPVPRKGHGRHGAAAYRGAERIEVRHEWLQAGDTCPECRQGTVYENSPGVLVRISGEAPLKAKVYQLQKLRCHLCGKIFTAQAPEAAGTRKYDATAAAMIGLLKYGSGLPFNRLEGLQRNLEIPLPASTQWDIVHAFAPGLVPAFDELTRQAAGGEVLHNDDTTVKILELMGDRAREVEEESQTSRTGLFTSGVVATRGGQRVALFFSGRQHAGENLQDVLKQRAAELGRPIQMCDALSRNLPKELETIVANCLAHARRQFVDVVDRFPEPCRYVLEALKVVYRNDAIARRDGMSPQQRLEFHQAHSRQTMTDLHDWLQRQFDEKRVEPNSALGEAIRYMLKHWMKLTLFLRQGGAPLDNNLCERALKKAILHRKNALFFKTRNGARVGDMYMSLIHTCELNGANPFDYLTELLRHTEQVRSNPAAWMPWNYRAALASLQPAA